MPASRSIVQTVVLYSLQLILLDPSGEYTELPPPPPQIPSHLPKNRTHHALSIGVAAEAMNPAILDCVAISQIHWTVLENGLGRE